MAFAESVRTLASQIEERRRHVSTEEAVKQALILPFLSVLGFDVWNPAEVIPEYRAGWAKATEKIDYAIQIGGRLALFVEAKGLNEALTNHDPQLAKYFNSTPEVKFAIITNGLRYRFFTDLQERNLLDKRPFFEFDFESFADADLSVLDRFRKEAFSVEKLVGYAEDLVFLTALKAQFKSLLREPPDDFIRFAVLAAKLTEGGRVTQRVVDRFRPLVKESISSAVLEIVGQSLQPPPPPAPEPEPQTPEAEAVAPRVVTTEEELALFDAVAQMVAEYVPEPSRLRYQDTQRYLSINYGGVFSWFVRMVVQSDGRKFLAFRLSAEQVQTLAPGWPVEGPTWMGESRLQFQDVPSLRALDQLFVTAVRAVAQ